jgi:hypothetical protein
MSFEGLAMAKPTIRTIRVSPNTGELAEISASRIPETPT